MLRTLVLPALLLTKLVTASDELAFIRQQENVLADAVRSRNTAVVSTLTDKDFHISWRQGTAIQSFETDVSRQAWIDGLSHLRIESYKIEISKVRRADKGERNQPTLGVYVALTESWAVLSARGHRISKRVQSLDLLVRKQGDWKLASRLSRSDQSP
jgi:hypothetical protein